MTENLSPEDITKSGSDCTYEEMDTYSCQFGDETVVECDTRDIPRFPATDMIASYDSYEATPHGTVLVYMSVTDKSTGDEIRQTRGYFCAADVKDQATADKICKLLEFQDTPHAVEWKRAGDVTDPKMRMTRETMDGYALRPIKMGSCDTVETCGLEEDWNLCGPEDSLSIKCE